MINDTNNFEKWNTNHWKNWIQSKLNERENVFASDPDELISSYNREIESSQSYAGREILELIQNADDAGEGLSKNNSMSIHLTSDAILVANTGIPFSPEGVKSLMLSDLSPKQLKKSHYIGYKGLGFRSVLGWANNIFISSGMLSVSFSKKAANSWLEYLIKSHDNIRSKIEEVRSTGLTNPIPILAVPSYFEFTDPGNGLSIETMNVFKELRESYTTVICLVLDNPEYSFDKVLQELKRIQPHILIFLQHLNHIVIKTLQWQFVCKVERFEGSVILESEGGTKQVWKVFTDIGKIPAKLLKSGQLSLTDYELRVAISQEGVDVNRLFVYFPTEVLFPFPLVVHGTFELTDNRQHLLESDINQWLVEKLSSLMATAAENSVNPNDPWFPMSLVTAQGNIDPVLQKLEFERVLLDEVARHKLIPVREGSLECPKDALRIKGNFDNLLTGNLFKEICLFTDNLGIEDMLDKLGVEFISTSSLTERLNKLSESGITIEQRGDLVFELLSNKLIDESDRPGLLVDDQNKIIPTSEKSFLPPEEKTFILPHWMKLKFLNQRLVRHLMEQFDANGARELARQLSKFRVQEYNMNEVVSSILNETNNRASLIKESELEIWTEALQVLFSIYSMKEVGNSPNALVTSPPLLISREGILTPANELYVGRDYPSGALLEYLYGNIGGPFVAGPDKLGLNATAEQIASFLVWLGVAGNPREENLESAPKEFFEYVLKKLTLPASFEGVQMTSIDDIRNCSPVIENVKSIDRIDKVLSHADPHSIIAWMRIDGRIDSWRTDGDNFARLMILPFRKQYKRKLDGQKIPSYIVWILQRMKWLPVTTGTLERPPMCTFARGVSKEFAAIVPAPAINIEHPILKKSNIDRTTLRSILNSIGVVSDIDDLPWDSYYQILLELPSRDPGGKFARSVYRSLVGRTDDAPRGVAYQKFMNEGKMWGKINEHYGYMDIESLYYLENHTVPDSISKFFPLVEIDRRRGASKINKLFGIKPLGMGKGEFSIKKYELHPRWKEFQEDLSVLKPFIYALRVEEDSDQSELGPLRALEIKLCKSAKGIVRVGDKDTEVELGQGDSLVADSVAYLIAEPDNYGKPLVSDEIIADSIGEIFSIVMRVDIGSDVARLATCSSSKRSTLLKKITGDIDGVRLKRTNTLLTINTEEVEETMIPSDIPEIAETQSAKQNSSQEQTLPQESRNEKINGVDVSSYEQIAPKPDRTVNLRVHGMATISVQGKYKRVYLAPERSESVALAFEKVQGRAPILVSHLQGNNTYWCDILSFKNHDELEKFKKEKNLTLVNRFIEVKGSVNSSGGILLKGNELKRAQEARERFYLYRIYEAEQGGHFELVVTSNPLEIEEVALERQFEVNPFKSTKSKKYELEEVK